MRKIQLGILLAIVLAPAVFADTVTLKNGDRITGTIISADVKTLVIKTDYADAVTIKWDFVQQIESSQPLYVGTKSGQVIVGPVTTSDSKLAVATKEAGSVAVAKADVTSLRDADEQKKAEAALDRLQHPRLADLWLGTFDTGVGLVRGNSDSTNFTFGLNAVRASTRDTITLYTISAFSRSAVNGVSSTTAQSIAGGVRYDLNVSDKAFGFGTVDLFNDRFQDLDLRTVIGAGGGYHAIKNNRTTFDVLLGGTFNLDGKEFRDLKVPRTVPPLVMQDTHPYTISVARDKNFQNMEFLDAKSLKPYEPQVKPLLQWWKSFRGHRSPESSLPPDPKCALDNTHAIFSQ